MAGLNGVPGPAVTLHVTVVLICAPGNAITQKINTVEVAPETVQKLESAVGHHVQVSIIDNTDCVGVGVMLVFVLIQTLEAVRKMMKIFQWGQPPCLAKC